MFNKIKKNIKHIKHLKNETNSFKKMENKIFSLLTNSTPHQLALGFAFGIFWGIMPSFGLAIIPSLLCAIIFKANKTSAIIGTFVSNPITVPILYFIFIYIGKLFTHTTITMVMIKTSIKNLSFNKIIITFIIGAIFFSLIISLIFYTIIKI